MRLTGERVYLRPLAREDTDLILAWRADREVQRQLFSARPPTRAEHEAWWIELQRRTDRQEFVIVRKADEQPVGTIGLSGIDREQGAAEYGLLIGEARWRGQGLAREASELMLHYAFEELGLQTVFLKLYADNARARRLYERLGFVAQPVSAVAVGSSARPTLTMALQRAEWRPHD